ncbi:MAG: hypothetical protein KC668_20245 [Myxococcales bacterium]|nr:hypothetical protein [Myxococcales bacterium]
MSAFCVLGGCSALFGYPDSAHESSVERCGNGLDDDFNGLVDCADPSCDGHCREDGNACTDGRNNNGDSFRGAPLVDRADPGCWGLGHELLEHCAFRPGTALELRRWTEFEAFPSPEWVTSGTVDEDGATLGINGEDSILLLPGQFIESRGAVTGGISDLGADVHFFGAAGTELLISFVSPRFGTIVTAHVVPSGGVDGWRMWMETADGARSTETTVDFGAFVLYYYEFNLVVNAGSWWLTAPIVGARSSPLPLDPAIPRDEPLVLRVEARGSAAGAVALVELVSVARTSYDTCDRSHVSPLINAPSLRAAADAPELRCVVLERGAHRSLSGDTWQAARSVMGPGEVAMTWVDTFERFEGVRYDQDNAGLRFFASADCDAFRESEPVSVEALTDATTVQLVGFDHDEDLPGGARRVHLLGVTQAGVQQLIELASDTGLPESYAVTSTVDWPHAVWPSGRPLSVGRLGASLWVLGPGEVSGDVALYAVTDGTVTTLDTQLLTPSGEPGAFDQFRVQQAQLVPRASVSPGSVEARLYYFGSLLPHDPGYESAAVRSGVDWRTLRFGPEAP